MQPYEIVRKNVVKVGGELRLAPEPTPAGVQMWSTFAAFVAGDAASIKKRVDEVRISFRADVIPVDGGAWISAGYNDLEKIVKALA